MKKASSSSSMLENFAREKRETGMKGSSRPWSPSVRGGGCPGSGNKLFPWRPAGSSMGNPMRESVLGLSILSALSIAGIHSAVNPSYFTLRSFAAQPQAKGAAQEGLWIGLGLSTAASVAIGLVFDEWIPAIISQATAVLLFGVGMYAVNSPPLITIPPIQSQPGVQQRTTSEVQQP
jgi:hypothetical protein